MENEIKKNSDNTQLYPDLIEIYSSVSDEKLFKYDIAEDTIELFTMSSADGIKKYTIPNLLTYSNVIRNILDSHDRNLLYRHLRYASTNPVSGKLEFRSSFFIKTPCWHRIHYRSSYDENGCIRYITGKIINIEDEKSLIRNIEENAGINKITQMYSYEAFCAKVAALIDTNKVTTGVVIAVELSNLREIAAKFGYDYTDALLRRYSKNIKSFYRGKYIFSQERSHFYLFTDKELSEDILKADCGNLIGTAKAITYDNAGVHIEAGAGIAFYPQDGDHIRALIAFAEKCAHINPASTIVSDVAENVYPEADEDAPESRPSGIFTNEHSYIQDKLIDFTETLFYNYRTYDVSQKAFSIIADCFDICRATIQEINGVERENTRFLFNTDYEVTENTPYLEEQIHTVPGSVLVYRIYRYDGSCELTPYLRKRLGIIFKIIHTYTNRFTSLQTTKFAKSHDLIFGCMNSYGFGKRLTEMKNRSTDFSNYSVLYMNVKEYKSINSKVGYENGNIVIHTIVEYFQKNLKDDEFFARAGGDNFSVFMRKDNIHQRIKEMNNIRCEIVCSDSTRIFNISFRIGVYMIEPYMSDTNDMLENASLAFNFARQQNNDDIVFYSNENREKIEHQKFIVNSLDPALKNGEIIVYFQPKVRLDDYSIVGAEALSRWTINGMIMPPDSFIPILTQTGMVSKIDFYVFEHVCHSLKKWIDNGITPVTISVNFEKSSLETPDFAQHIYSIAQKYDTPIKYLEIEFTERSCMDNESKFIDILSELKKCGFHASLDDFGKGYSSINVLKNMNFDFLKLDKSFLTEEKMNNDRSRIILKSVIKMAHCLNIEVISEGVETIEQINYLKLLKCETTQGYYFDKPLPHEIFQERLVQGKYYIS